MKKLLLTWIFAIAAGSLALAPRVTEGEPSNTDVDEMLRLHSEVLEAHRNDEVDRWLASESDEIIMVSRGEVLFPSKDERKPHIESYLKNTVFEQYEDLIEPIVRVSDDGTLGWLIAQVKIVGTRDNSDGETVPINSVWAWIELYEKKNGRWFRVGNVSNVKPQDSQNN